MRKFTFLIIGLVFAAFTTTTQAQSFDAGVTDLPTVTAGQTVYPNVPVTVGYTRENFGTTSITSADVDSLTMEIHVDGIKRQTFYRNMANPFAPGAGNAETTQGVSPVDWGTLGITAGNVAVCAQTRLWKGGQLIDANPNNDQTCKVLVYAGDNNPLTYDFAIENIILKDVFNTYTDGQTLPSGFVLVELGFDLKNAGSVQVPEGISFEVTITTGGVTSGPFLGTAPGMSPGGSTPFTIANSTAGVTLPTTSPVNVCMKLVPTNDDTNHSNDEGCSDFLLPTGIDEADVEYFEMNYFNRSLSINMLESVNGPVEVSIISVGGQEVYSETYDASNNNTHEVNLNQLNSGVFIAKVIAENGIIETTRFVVE